jgi:hypothetical protein
MVMVDALITAIRWRQPVEESPAVRTGRVGRRLLWRWRHSSEKCQQCWRGRTVWDRTRCLMGFNHALYRVSYTSDTGSPSTARHRCLGEWVEPSPDEWNGDGELVSVTGRDGDIISIELTRTWMRTGQQETPELGPRGFRVGPRCGAVAYSEGPLVGLWNSRVRLLGSC